MLDLSETFVFDAVVHAYNFDESNFRVERHARGFTEMLYGFVDTISPPEYSLPREQLLRNWGVEEHARLLFLESHTDVACFQPTPLNSFYDGLASVEKARESQDRWPDRFVVYATVDPLADDALEELEKQVEELDPLGLKLYPTTWGSDTHRSWRMDDPSVAFPVFERARELGLNTIAIHKSLPVGPVPREPFDPGDVDGAAEAFPNLRFSIVHGGLSFTEETAWQVANFPNVYINMEGLFAVCAGSPRRFAEILVNMMDVGGPGVLDRLFWSTGSLPHPRLQMESFLEFTIPEDLLERGGLASPLPQITEEHKRNILGRNYARFHGLDIERLLADVEDDEFDRQRRRHGLAAPFSTTNAAGDTPA